MTDTFKLNNENDYISLENYTTFTVALHICWYRYLGYNPNSVNVGMFFKFE